MLMAVHAFDNGVASGTATGQAFEYQMGGSFALAGLSKTVGRLSVGVRHQEQPQAQSAQSQGFAFVDYEPEPEPVLELVTVHQRLLGGA